MKTKLITTIMITLFLASMLSMAFVAPVAATPSSSLVGLWHFDEGTGYTAYDSSGVSPPNDGTLNLGTWGTTDPALAWVDGKFGKALKFDGGDDYVDCGLAVDDTISTALTLEAWIKPEPQWMRGFLSNSLAPTTKKGYNLFITDAPSYGRVIVDVGVGTAYGRAIYYIPSAEWWNQWHHVASTWDGSYIRLYVDGSEVASTPRTGTYSEPDTSTFVGKMLAFAPFKGIIDEVRIWSRALSAPEVAASFGLGDTIHPVQIKEKDLDGDGDLDVIFNSALYELSDGEPITVCIVPIDPSIKIDYATMYQATPKGTNGCISPEPADGDTLSVTFTVYTGTPPSKTLHIWIYLTDGAYTGEHVGFNAQFVR